MRQHLEVGARARRVEVGHRGRAALAVAHGQLVEADALLVGAVEVGVGAVARRLRRRHPRLDHAILRTAVRDAKRTVGAVALGLPAGVPLGSLEVGQHVGPAPARRTQRRPVVEVGRCAAHVEHGVHRRGTAEHLAPREEVAAVVELWLGLGYVVPVAVTGELAPPQGWNGEELAVGGAARLDEDDLDRRVLAQARREGGAGRAGADDHVISEPG